MRRTAALTALLLALWPVAVWPACAGRDLLAAMKPDRRAETLARAAGVPYPEGNLWRAERNGAVVHLAGTLHVGDPRLGPVMARLAPLIEAAQAEARAEGIGAKDVTPFLLGRLAHLSGGATVAANGVLAQDNACLAAEIAIALHRIAPA